MIVAAGRLRDRVELQNPPAIDDDSGGQVGGWTFAASIAAEVMALAADESVEATIVTGITRYRVTVRTRAVTTAQRLVWKGQALNIKAVLPDPKRATLRLLCEGVTL